MPRYPFVPIVLGWLWAGVVGAQQYDLRVFTVEDGLPGGAINAIREDSTGRLWLDTEGGLCRFDGRRFITFSDREPPPPGEIRATWVERDGRYSLLRATGPIGIAGLTHAELRTRDGSTWLGTTNGAEVITPHGASAITEANGLGGDDVRCLYQDRSGTIWIGTSVGGLTRYSGDAFIHFTERDGLNARMVTAIHRTPDGLLWFGTNSGYVAYWDGQRVMSLGIPTGTYPAVRCLADDGKGHLLIGTETGLHELEVRSGRVKVLLADMAINDIAILPDERMMVATNSGLHEVGVSATRPNQPKHARINDLCMIGTQLFIAGADGVSMLPLDEGSVRRLFHIDSLEATAIAADRMGNLWIGTRGRGLLRDDHGRMRYLTTAEGLASNDVEQLLLDAYDNLWIGTRAGFDHLELDENQQEVINITHYGRDDGFISSEALRHACFLDMDSTLWFGTARGATRFDPRELLVDPHAPRTWISDVLLDHEHADWSRWSDSIGADGLPIGLSLPHDRDHLTFLFEGVSLAHPEKVRYQFILEGLDAEWSPISSTDRAVYSGLPPGEYTFKVIARNASGVWNEVPASFSFTIEPPFHKTTGFMAGSGLLLLTGLWSFVRLRERRQRRERARLEGMVKVRTRELEDEKHRSDSLLLNILPETTAAELKERGTAEARAYAHCTVLFSDFQGFTTITDQMEGAGIVAELDRFFRAFDRITSAHALEKIKTIGDAYMCAAGVPNERKSHALDAVLTALEMLDAVDRINAERALDGRVPWPIRIGLHSGPLVAGVVGEKKFAFDIWGGTVNLASRMESNGKPDRINISGATYALAMDFVLCSPRGPIRVKGKGEVQMYFVERLRPEFSGDPKGRLPNQALLDRRTAMVSIT